MKCVQCMMEMHLSRETIVYDVKGSSIVVDDVEMLVCPNRHRYLTSEGMSVAEKALLEKGY